jgi:predicted transcriptional regulator
MEKHKMITKVFSIRLGIDLLKKINALAKKEDRSRNYIIVSVLKKYFMKED